ncbi:MAG: ATP synthase subunit I [Lachnospiraceae bacterium]|nr:ATP synthase subunit I [Lachnospiraceae bacterium]
MAKLQAAVKKETLTVTVYTIVGTIIMFIGFVIFDFLTQEFGERLNFLTVILGGVCGAIVAVLNFFLMALTVQRVTYEEDEKRVASIWKLGFMRRMLFIALWIIAAIVAPCFNWVAGIIPLLIPSLGIKAMGIIRGKNNKSQEVERKQDGH